jgi:hypothetical protein
VAEPVDRDTEQVNLLVVLHYAAAGVTALIACFPLIHVTVGALLAFFPDFAGGKDDAPPREIGLFFMAIGLALVSAGWSMAGAHFFVARSLKARRRYVACVVLSAITCFACLFSSGIVSIATLVILMRPGVKELFAEGGSTAAVA